jgi:uncharacterized protein (TIGR00159 family)
MIELAIQPLRLIDFIDIILSCVLVYFIYKMLKGTNALSILIAFFVLFIIWRIVSFFQMHILSEIIGQFISVGAIGIIIIFQPEIRRFFTMIGSKSMERGKRGKFLFWKITNKKENNLNTSVLVQAYQHLSQSKTGALIVLSKRNDLESIIHTGEVLDCEINSQLIETIFFKNTPLHDGALIIKGNTIKAARCILPVSTNYNIPASLGLRHRSGIGITEQTDAISIMVSEQTGNISIAKAGNLEENISPTRLQEFLNNEFNS